MPAGTRIHCVAHFDNSEDNLANPDPTATVRWGDQTWEEMMIGYFDMALADQDLSKPTATRTAQFRQAYASGRQTLDEKLVALAADTISITIMEIVDNGVLLLYPGAMEAGLGDALFWWSLAFALAVAWVVTFPVNRWLISRGRGHAVAHAHHGHE